VCCPWLLAETKVATILGIFFFLLLGVPSFKTPEGVDIWFQRAPEKINKNSGGKKFGPYPLAPWGWFLLFFGFFKISKVVLDWVVEMFKGDSAATCAGKFQLVSMGAERRISHGSEDPHRR
jgi:hypothetical protein